jgi:hypothetical protein
MVTTALLTLDRGSVLLPADSLFPEIATVNSHDGEIIKLVNTGTGFGHIHRHLQDVEDESTSGNEDWPTAVANLADKQAFSFRQNGEPATFIDVDNSPQTLELEPLENGGILIGNERQLPFGVYLKSAESYRVRLDGSEVVLEYRPDNRSEWEEVDHAAVTELHHLISELADRTDMVCLERPHRTDIETAIDAHFGNSLETPKSPEEEEIAERTALATDSAFDPNIPIPAPLLD